MSEPQGFFQRRPLRRALYNWLERHQHPFNRGIHFIGIPLVLDEYCPAGTLYALHRQIGRAHV